MKLTQSVRYRIDFQSDWAQASAALAGAFLFLRAVFYFGFTDLSRCGAGELIMELILPWLLGLGFIVLLRGILLQRPLVFGVLGAALCLLLAVQGFSHDATAWAIVGLVWYLLAGAAMLGTVLGYLPEPRYLLIAFWLPALVRFLAMDLGAYVLKLRVISFLPEAANLCLLIGLGCLALCLQPERSGMDQEDETQQSSQPGVPEETILFKEPVQEPAEPSAPAPVEEEIREQTQPAEAEQPEPAGQAEQNKTEE